MQELRAIWPQRQALQQFLDEKCQVLLKSAQMALADKADVFSFGRAPRPFF